MFDNDSTKHLSVREFRLQFLERFIQEAISLIDPDLCSQNIGHIQGKLASALAEEDMNF